MALQVEKTSKRGGRIIHEKEMMPPPQFAVPAAPVSSSQAATSSAHQGAEPSITEIMRQPSKVVLLRVSRTSCALLNDWKLDSNPSFPLISEYGWSR